MKSALVVVDVQKYFITRPTKDVAKRILRFIEKNRDKFDFIIFLKFVNKKRSSFVKYLKWKGMMCGRDTELIKELNGNKKIVFERFTYSAFNKKSFVEFLKRNKIKKLFLCGFDTDACITFNLVGGFDLGYDIKVIKDLCMSHYGKKYHDYAIKFMEKNFCKEMIIKSSSVK